MKSHQAHDHAKAASDATQTANSTVAVNEHTRAAGEFSNAAKVTSSIEALRTLRLLEQHHQKLSELIQFSIEHPAKQALTEKDVVESGEKAAASTVGPDAKPDPTNSASATSKPSGTIPGLTPQRRYPPSRELSSSIASNLASARGIRNSRRGQPVAPSVSNDQAPGNVDVLARKEGSRTRMQHMLDSKTGKPKPSWVPPSQPSAQSTRPPSIDETPQEEYMRASATSDEGFSRFYSTFGSIINRLSAPLAFAGLPLIAEEQAPADSPAPESAVRRRSRAKSIPPPGEEPDLSKIYSKAALRAVYRDGHSGIDSFYVVPTSGHTVSYANILNFDQKEKRRAMAASVHGGQADVHDDQDEEDFVDARESQMTLSPSTKRRVGKSQTERDLYNVIEELNTENESLKGMLDKVTKRLHAFEASAQHSRLAMVDSLRLARPGSPMSQSGGPQMSDESLRKRNRELEEDLARGAKQFEMLQKDNKHLQRTVDKYREKWEALKAGAKARREASHSADA